jgi:hypothetical protein
MGETQGFATSFMEKYYDYFLFFIFPILISSPLGEMFMAEGEKKKKVKIWNVQFLKRKYDSKEKCRKDKL